MKSLYYLIWIIIFLALFPITGCAFMNKDNRVLLNQLDKQIDPKNTAGRVALAPVMIPVATTAGALDIVVIHPVSEIPSAAEDTYDALWKPRGHTPFKKALLFIPALVSTPPFFTGVWIWRSMFEADWW